MFWFKKIKAGFSRHGNVTEYYEDPNEPGSISPSKQFFLSAPQPAFFLPTRLGQTAYESEAFARQVAQASISQMIIAVEVYRQSEINEVEIIPQISASRFLVRGPGEHASDFGWILFTSIFQSKINTDYLPKNPIVFVDGQLGYFTTRAEYVSVKDQEGFEVALGHMFLNRGNSDVMKFIYQPEPEELRKERLKREAEEREIIFRKNALHAANVALPESPPFEIVIGDAPPTPDSTPQRRDFRREAREQTLKDFEGTDGDQKPLLSPTTSTDTKSSAEWPSSIEEVEEMHQITRQISNAETVSTHSCTPSLRGGILGTRSLRSPGRPRSRLVISVPTREEERVDFRELVKEAGRVSYKSGGDEDQEEETIHEFEEADRHLTDDEAELPEEAEDDDEDISEEDRIVAKLQDLQNLGVLTQLKSGSDRGRNSARWEECGRMFRIDPARTGLNEVVAIAGLKTKIYQYQAFGVYWQMITSRELGGGFVADAMGLGKTLSFLAYFVVERQLSALWRDVEKSRAAKDGKHLLGGEQDEKASCPSGSRAGWIACPCVHSNPTSKMAPQPGLRMACVPNGLVQTWWKQWKAHVDVTDTVLALKIIVDYPGAFGVDATMDDMLFSSAKPQNRNRITAEKFPVKGARSDGKGDDKPKDYHEGLLLLTTKGSFQAFTKHFESTGQIHDPKKLGEWKSGTRTALIFGIAMIDESHEDYFKNKGRAEVLTKLPTTNTSVRPFLWGYSGTPFSQNPRGLEGVLWAIEKHAPQTVSDQTGWQTNPKFQKFEWHKLDGICKQFDRLVKGNKRDDAAVQKVLADFERFLTTFVIRRTADTMWFGHTLIKLKPHIHQDVTLFMSTRNKKIQEFVDNLEEEFQSERDEALASLQAKWDNFPESRRSDIRPTKLAFNTDCRLRWRSRFLATIPWIQKMSKTRLETPMTFTDEELMSYQGSDTKEQGSPYRRYIRNILEDSPKCLWLYHFIGGLAGQVDVDGNEQKVVVLTGFNQVAFEIKLIIKRYFPEYADRVGMVAGRMKLKEKRDILDAFTDAVDANGKRKTKKDIKFLIGATRLLGIGLQLTRACNLILMEPDNEFTKELQGYARVHRIGQRNPLSRSYRLIMAESSIEQRIVKRQADRREFFGKPLTVEANAELDRADKLIQEIAMAKEREELAAYQAEVERLKGEKEKSKLARKGNGKGESKEEDEKAGEGLPSRVKGLSTKLTKKGM